MTFLTRPAALQFIPAHGWKANAPLCPPQMGVPAAALGGFLRRFPSHHVLLTGLYKPDLEKLAPEHTNFSADIAFCEWTNTLEHLLKKIPANRLMLGTCTPLLSTRAETDKLVRASLPARTKALIGSENARRFFNL